MSSSLSKREVNRQRWSERIQHWKRSDLTQKAFCERHQIGLASFQRWRGIFAQEEKSKAPPATFLPINIVQSASTPSLALCLGEDLRIEIPVGFDPVMLKQVVHALRAS
jgi:hypothetical protein